eukprot:GDKI01023764.1.p1 GENE.GDKI01023764.1~~GDKI01023764.1.p1  ORF type:complete len:233 (-),score=67.69 GDKI01023764.1:197-895(-)
MVVTKKMKIRMGNPVKKPNPLWRPPKNLFSESCIEPERRKGVPLLDKVWDAHWTLNRPSAFKKYKPPPKPKPPLRTDFTPQNWHEMKGRFRFVLEGQFDEGGELFKNDLIRTCKDLSLVGWVKCRKKFAIGHLYGDVYGLSYAKKFLSEKMSPGARIESVKFHDENFGIRGDKDDMPYRYVRVMEEYRKPSKLKMHTLQIAGRVRVAKMQEESAQRRYEIEKFLDENCVRNY